MTFMELSTTPWMESVISCRTKTTAWLKTQLVHGTGSTRMSSTPHESVRPDSSVVGVGVGVGAGPGSPGGVGVAATAGCGGVGSAGAADGDVAAAAGAAS